MDTDDLHTEIAHNFDVFQRTLTDHLRTHRGKFALMKSRHIIGFFDIPTEADRIGWSRYSDKLYAIQQVTAQPVDLGRYANADDCVATQPRTSALPLSRARAVCARRTSGASIPPTGP